MSTPGMHQCLADDGHGGVGRERRGGAGIGVIGLLGQIIPSRRDIRCNGGTIGESERGHEAVSVWLFGDRAGRTPGRAAPASGTIGAGSAMRGGGSEGKRGRHGGTRGHRPGPKVTTNTNGLEWRV